jgi:hypothetical protein
VAASKDIQQLGRAVAALEAAPGDLGAWFRVGTALARAGRRDEGGAVLAELGAAASERGHVALAVACARWLAQAKDTARADALARSIAATHAAGSERIDPALRPQPPAPPRGASQPGATDAAAESPKDIEAAVARAVAASRASAGRAPSRPDAKLAPTPLVGALTAAEIAALTEPVAPLVDVIEREVRAVAALDVELRTLDEGAMVRALAASEARAEPRERRAPLLAALDRLRALEEERCAHLARLLEASSLLRRAVELGLRVGDPEALHARQIQMALAALEEG